MKAHTFEVEDGALNWYRGRMKVVVYIAGKYRGPNSWAIECNIRKAEEMAAKVWAMGLIALCPHSNSRHMEGVTTDQHMLDGTMELMRRCDAVLLLNNWRQSEGALGEIEEAKSRGIPIFGTYSEQEGLEDLELWANGKPVKHGQPFGPQVPGPRTCNRHTDCDVADAKAKAAGRLAAEHCRDETCEECLG